MSESIILGSFNCTFCWLPLETNGCFLSATPFGLITILRSLKVYLIDFGIFSLIIYFISRLIALPVWVFCSPIILWLELLFSLTSKLEEKRQILFVVFFQKGPLKVLTLLSLLSLFSLDLIKRNANEGTIKLKVYLHCHCNSVIVTWICCFVCLFVVCLLSGICCFCVFFLALNENLFRLSGIRKLFLMWKLFWPKTKTREAKKRKCRKWLI